MTIAATVSTVGHGRVNPSVYLRPTAQPISNKPATIRMNQFMTTPLSRGVVPGMKRVPGSSHSGANVTRSGTVPHVPGDHARQQPHRHRRHRVIPLHLPDLVVRDDDAELALDGDHELVQVLLAE